MTPSASLAVVDCPTGLAGNMLLAALFDLGLPEAVVAEPLAALGLEGRYRLQLDERSDGGLRGLHLAVESLEPEPGHRHWSSLERLIAGAPLPPLLQQQVLQVFGLLAEVEGAVHGHPPEQVHFHEVGALDALVDVVGVCAGLQHFGVRELLCTPPPAGHGTVRTAHGLLPLPAPAVLELARRRGLPLASSASFPPGELTTPTGLVLMAVLADRFMQAPPALIPRAVGIGLGSRALDRPNLLRLWLAEPQPDTPLAGGSEPSAPRLEPLLQQQAQIDDATAEDLAFLAAELRSAGAVEVFTQPIQMKKGRPAVLLTALAPPERAEALRQLWWRHSSTLGLREQQQSRWVLQRRSLELATPLGTVRIKQALLPDGRWRTKPEHDDLAALARQHTLGIDQVRAVVQEALAAELDSSPSQSPRSDHQP
ncbi:MAG: nickel pincer cofactor biosynthesis protein LarC [Synechococcaceae bacterium WB8_1B_136]|nr:nickel pincer cofactor biosynthesis protein LarC [Synechococcaceae bacterium WB8_1B_136]